VDIIPTDGILVACSQWPVVREVCEDAGARVVWYGDAPSDDWQLRNVNVSGSGTDFSAFRSGTHVADVSIRFPGMHNALNALAVLALCTEIGMKTADVAQGLSLCQGVKRRQEVRGERGGITVIDDFAHHPSAVKVTIQALKAQYAGRRLVVVFEPRTNTSRRAVFQERYARAFDSADRIIVRAVPDPEKAPEGDRFSSEKLVEDLKKQGKDAVFLPDAKAILKALLHSSHQGDVIAILSNGDFEGLHTRLLKALPE
jgi:UDP-N-acetylmuramate: L-alanyl-gamma-D-glutamyl-meso-diaminopimelate ligase